MKCSVLLGGIFNFASASTPDVLRRIPLSISDMKRGLKEGVYGHSHLHTLISTCSP
jgi:hypothetical protein